jgi:hypothetical protein
LSLAWLTAVRSGVIQLVEGYCERSKADRHSVRSHKTLALPLRGLAWLLTGGSHLLLIAMSPTVDLPSASHGKGLILVS